MNIQSDTILKSMGEKAEDATDAAKEMSSLARTGFMDTIERIGRVYVTLRNFGVDDALSRVGLRRRGSGGFATAVAFGTGFVAGAGVATLLAPASGLATRRMIAAKVRSFFPAEDAPPEIAAPGASGEAIAGAKNAVAKRNGNAGAPDRG